MQTLEMKAPVPSRRFLVVDRDALSREGVARELLPFGDVIAVTDARAARGALERTAYDAIICDVWLAENDEDVPSDALDVLTVAAHACPSAVRILVTTGLISLRVEDAIRLGVVGWVLERPWEQGALAHAAVRRSET